jgi:DNA-binding PadR family transcriptional regulator
MSISHVLLGVLAAGPAHGYDLKREHDARFPGAKELAYGQVYSSLQRLERDGFVEVAETLQGGGPERTVYALTAAGQKELAGWLAGTEAAGPYAADELVRKTVTALRLGTDAGEFLERQRVVHLARMRELLESQASITDPAGRVAIDHTVFHLDADLRWLEAAVGRVTSTNKTATHMGAEA